jgi:hypothetical protein
MPREVDLKLDLLLNELAPGMHWVELAARIGVSEGTLRGYMENRWRVLDRTVLERLADFFQCEAGSLLTTTESGFFDPFRVMPGQDKYPTPTCFYLRRPDADALRTGRPLAYRDHRAIDRVATLLRDWVDGIVKIEDSAPNREQFDERLLQNCVVVGSPLVNPASEMAICRAFGVDPFNPGQSAQAPLAFKMAAAVPPRSAIVETAQDGKQGIWLRKDKELLAADVWPREEFRRVRIQKGRDCGLVVVMNHQPTDPGHFRKLVVLSGFTGVGTEAAAQALADCYRDLEPRAGETHVWGLIEVFYRKPANSTTREILNYNWRCRAGGRCPSAFVKKIP